ASVRAAGEQQPVVQPFFAALPELQCRGRQAVAAPVFWPWRSLPGVLVLELLQARLEFLARRDYLTLQRDDRAELAWPRAGGKIGVRFVRRDPCHAALDPHLALHLRPPEADRRIGVGGQFGALAALVIRVEDEAAVVVTLEQQHTHARLSVCVNG